MSCASRWTVVLLAFAVAAGVNRAGSQSIEVSGSPTYTISSEGVKMLFANPYDCERPATDAKTWVIKLEQPEMVNSFQLAVVDANSIEGQEEVAVRVGNSDPTTEGAFSNSICAVADINATSSMSEFECEMPVSGTYITVSRNDGGDMNVCGFSANLGKVALAPFNALAPEVFIPASELDTPQSPSQLPLTEQTRAVPEETEAQTPAPAPVTATQSVNPAATLPTFQATGELQSFATVPTPAPAPGPVLAPRVAVNSISDYPVLSTVPTPAPAPSPVLAPQVATQSISDLPVVNVVPTPAPAPSPVMAPTVAVNSISTLPVVPTPAPVPAPVPEAVPYRVTLKTPAPAPAPNTLPRNIFVADQPQPTPAAASSSPQTGSSLGTVTKSGSGLSGGAIAGIVIGVVAGVALLASVAYVLYQKSHKTSSGRPEALSRRINPVYDA